MPPRKKPRTIPDDVVRKAVIYCRVSTQEQANSGLGLESQETRCRGYCVAQGWEVAGVYVDAGVSARTLDRPELRAAIAALPEWGVLVVLKLDRLTRTVEDMDPLQRLIEARGAEWVAVQERFDTSTAMGRFVLRVYLAASQADREVTGERTSAALSVKRDRGERLGTTPLGFTTDADGLVSVDPEAMRAIERARSLQATGATLRAIANTLTAEGHRTKRGGAWQPETVRKILLSRHGANVGATGGA